MVFDIDDDIVIDEVKKNYTLGDLYSDSEIIAYIIKNFMPEEVFDLQDLEEWADQNGFIKI